MQLRCSTLQVNPLLLYATCGVFCFIAQLGNRDENHAGGFQFKSLKCLDFMMVPALTALWCSNIHFEGCTVCYEKGTDKLIERAFYNYANAVKEEYEVPSDSGN